MVTDDPIWPGQAPGAPAPLPAHTVTPRDDGGANATSVAIPGFAIYRPERPNGHAVLLCQGGGYERVGRVPLIPQWFAAQGFTVFDLLYRLPAQGWAAGPDAPLQDAQQAMRVIRARAGEFGVTGAVGVAGFSAGGHVAASLATRFDEALEAQVSAASARPDFALLMCPVITMLGDGAHNASRRQLLGAAPAMADLERHSAERRVTADTPPALLVHAADDPVVPVGNSLAMFAALRAAKVPAQLHVFGEGGHLMSQGFRPDTALSAYPALVLEWLATRIDLDRGEAA